MEEETVIKKTLEKSVPVIYKSFDDSEEREYVIKNGDPAKATHDDISFLVSLSRESINK